MIPEIDGRTKNDILKYIKSVSSSYTPEWRFDTEHPDPGVALSMIFADMYEGSIRRFNRIPERYRIAFFNELNASCQPSVPAIGYVGFTLAGGSDGEQIKKGTQLTAETSDDQGYTVFETQNDVCAVNAEPVAAFAVSGAKDRISRLYDLSGIEEQNPSDRAFELFAFDDENLQEHTMYFCSDTILDISKNAWIEVTPDPHFINQIPQGMLESLIDESYAKWEYYTENGWTSFSGMKLKSSSLLLYKSDKQPAFKRMELEEKESFWIRLTIKDVSPFEALHLDSLGLSARSAELIPEHIYSAEMDQEPGRFFAFGPTFTAYSEMYIACDDALCKKGARVSADFALYFADVPLELDVADTSVNWKLIMKRSQVRIDQEYDLTASKVIWEYYNGSGWAKLFELASMEELFAAEKYPEEDGGYRHISLEFTCPDDMESVLVNSHEAKYIRARIVKVNNAYKVKGRYRAPVIEGLTFRYSYEAAEYPEKLITVNSMEKAVYDYGKLADRSYYFTPFKRAEDKQASLYIGFNAPLTSGPVRMLFTLKDILPEKPGRLDWEYMSERGFRPLNAADETDNFRKTGIVTFMPPDDFVSETLWGKDLFWIRIVDAGSWYEDDERIVPFPQINGIWMNVTEVRNVESQKLEYFTIEQGAEDYKCPLLEGGIQDIEVDVLEEGQWVRWSEVPDFSASSSDSRHYTADRTDGIISFSDGFYGKIPPSGDTDTIRVVYSTGGGKKGNLPAGAINGSKLSMGSVGSVFNPGVTFGGCDIETSEKAMKRTAATIKHRNRAVTPSDFEALALEASGNVARAKCFSGYDEKGQRKPGAVTLVLLQDDFRLGRDYFHVIRNQVEKHLERYIDGELKARGAFAAAEPRFMEISVKAEITVGSYHDVFAAEDAVKSSLNSFLDPLYGNFDGKGWEIGKLPNVTQLKNCLRKISEIKYIGNIYVTVYTNTESGRVETDLDGVKDIAFALPYSGTHTVSVSVDEGR